MYIEKIKVKNFRNFNEAELEFQDGINIIVGPNNSGKTNLLEAINFIRTTETITIHDFNKNNIIKKLDIFRKEPPKLEFTYYIRHDLKTNEYNDAILRLRNFLTFTEDADLYQHPSKESDGDNEENLEEKSMFVQAIVILKYEFDHRMIDMYRDTMKNVKVDEFFLELEGLLGSYKWNYYNKTSDQRLEGRKVKDIFNVDFIEAERKSTDTLRVTQHYVKKEMERLGKNHRVSDRITDLLKEEFTDITSQLTKTFSTGISEIGLGSGGNNLDPNFSYDGRLNEYFNYQFSDDYHGYELPSDYNGLGYNNLVQILSIIKFKANQDFNLLLIEEPEAHLHPAMQYKLFEYLEGIRVNKASEEYKIRNQVFITTHSSNITASADLDNLIKLEYVRSETEREVKSTKMEEQYHGKDTAKKHLMKFLDVTRSDMLFTNKVILVEGLAEKLLMPAFLEKIRKENDLSESEFVSIVEIGGINFDYFLPAFKGTSTKVICFRDLDYSYYEESENEEKILKDLGTYKDFRKGFKKDMMIDNKEPNIRMYTQQNLGSTFENELFIDNFNCNNKMVISEMFKLPLPETLRSYFGDVGFSLEGWIKRLDEISNGNTRKKVKNFIKPYENYKDRKAEKKAMVFFANLFLEYAKNKKGDIALSILTDEEIINDLIVPDYIRRGIEWLLE